ncbi:hypothetical protein [Silanimonas sp.]|uniref:hypothetical protein n=1 Tax=Silanimonas sp. TaxID=1929290 RepID=UPI0026182F57|nr:hypothetical protein [Silanimonas sp.]
MRVRASSFGLVVGTATCHACSTPTPVARLWVPEYTYHFEPDDELEIEADPAMLSFVSDLSAAAMVRIQAHAPWLRMAPTRTSGMTYLANHCACGAVQGDHYLGVPGEAFFPLSQDQLQGLRFLPCEGPLEAEASPGSSAWMVQVPSLGR